MHKTLPRWALGSGLVWLLSLNSTGEIAQPAENLSCKYKDPNPITRIYIKSRGQWVTWEAEAEAGKSEAACLVKSQ